MARLVYRSGSATDDKLPPRLGKDTSSKPGNSPGLSVFVNLEQAVGPGGKAQVIDLDLLAQPLKGFADQEGEEGHAECHIAIAPATAEGHLDHALLDEWARSRDSDSVHWLTVLIKEALVDTVWRPK